MVPPFFEQLLPQVLTQLFNHVICEFHQFTIVSSDVMTNVRVGVRAYNDFDKV